jgi:hypothetical protein
LFNYELRVRIRTAVSVIFLSELESSIVRIFFPEQLSGALVAKGWLSELESSIVRLVFRPQLLALKYLREVGRVLNSKIDLMIKKYCILLIHNWGNPFAVLFILTTTNISNLPQLSFFFYEFSGLSLFRSEIN